LPHTTTIDADVIHDIQLPRKQRGKQRRPNLTPDQMEQSKARRRATYRKHLEHGTIDLEEKNTTLREWRACSKEKGELSAKRKATYAAKKNTPCKESLALPRPDLANLSRAKPLSRAAEDDSSDGDPPTIMPNYIVGTNGMIILLSHYCAHSHQPSSDMTLSIVTFATAIMQTTSMGSETASWAMRRHHPTLWMRSTTCFATKVWSTINYEVVELYCNYS
jgi:hypothetical protein